MLQRKTRVSFLSLFFLTSGCAVFDEHSLDTNDILLVQAEERAIYKNLVEMHAPGIVTTVGVTCMEPSPDVAQAIQRALSAAVEHEKVNANVSYSSATGIAQLAERTTSIQLLRDQMFRACEAYANGAINGTSYSLLMSRNNKAMITLMLGENASTAFGRQGAHIGGKTSGSVDATRTGLVKDFSDALDKLAIVDKEVDEAKEAFTNAEQALALCEKEFEEYEKKEDKGDAPTCPKDSLAETKSAAEETLKEKNQKKQNALAMVNSTHEANIKTAAEIVQVNGIGGLTGQVTDNVAETLRKMQEQYLNNSVSDEYISACLIELGMTDLLSKDVETSAIKTLNTDSNKNVYRTSALGQTCFENLDQVLRSSEANRQSLKKAKLALQKDQVKLDSLKLCNSLGDNKYECFKMLGMEVKPPQPDRKPDSISVKDILSIDDVVAIQKLIKAKDDNEAGIKKSLAALDKYKDRTDEAEKKAYEKVKEVFRKHLAQINANSRSREQIESYGTLKIKIAPLFKVNSELKEEYAKFVSGTSDHSEALLLLSYKTWKEKAKMVIAAIETIHNTQKTDKSVLDTLESDYQKALAEVSTADGAA